MKKRVSQNSTQSPTTSIGSNNQARRSRKRASLITALVIDSPIMAGQSHAVGLQLMPSASNFGTAGAGHAAEGRGAGSAWANPATMSLLEGNQIGFGLVAAETSLEFEAEDSTLDSGGDAGVTALIPSFSYVHNMSDDLKLGFSVVVPFGNEIDYGSDWAGANTVTNASVETIQAQPVISYRVNPNLSIGGGINVNYTRAKQELSPSASLGGRPPIDIDSDISLDADDVAYGWTAGALWEFNPEHRIGVVYRSKVESDLEGEADANIDYSMGPVDGTLMDTSLDTMLNWENPGSVVFSGYHKVSDKVAFLWDVGRTFYSDFETTSIDLDGLPLSLDLERNWKDANRYAVGAHYHWSKDLILQAGFSYDESPVDTADRTADLPLDDTKRYTVGAMYQATNDLGVSLGLEYVDLGNAKIEDHGTLLSSPAGDYDNSAVAASLSFNYKL